MKYLKFFKKWKIAFFIWWFLSGLVSIPSATSVFDVVVCLVIIIAGIIPMVPDILYLKKDAPVLWEKWRFVEGNADETRKWRAQNGELTPLYIDETVKFGKFASSDGKPYRTTLVKCTCPDFQKRQVPCKHMYYLADKCNIAY